MFRLHLSDETGTGRQLTHSCSDRRLEGSGEVCVCVWGESWGGVRHGNRVKSIVELTQEQEGGDSGTRAIMTWVHVCACVFKSREVVWRG